MANTNVTWSGLDKLMEELSATAGATIEAASSAMKITTGQVQATAKQVAPKEPDTWPTTLVLSQLRRQLHL